jgi:hypothetical protein
LMLLLFSLTIVGTGAGQRLLATPCPPHELAAFHARVGGGDQASGGAFVSSQAVSAPACVSTLALAKLCAHHQGLVCCSLSHSLSSLNLFVVQDGPSKRADRLWDSGYRSSNCEDLLMDKLLVSSRHGRAGRGARRRTRRRPARGLVPVVGRVNVLLVGWCLRTGASLWHS